MRQTVHYNIQKIPTAVRFASLFGLWRMASIEDKRSGMERCVARCCKTFTMVRSFLNLDFIPSNGRNLVSGDLYIMHICLPSYRWLWRAISSRDDVGVVPPYVSIEPKCEWTRASVGHGSH